MKLNQNRIRTLSKNTEVEKNKTVVYWMSRDQRVHNNWALLYAQQLANEKKSNLVVAFTLSPSFLGATLRQYDFMLQGLQEVEMELKKYNIPFILLVGEPARSIVTFVERNEICCVVTDFSPMKISRKWKQDLVVKTSIPIFEVDAHNVIPAWITSEKQEYSARTIRPKIHSKLGEYLTDFPKLQKQIMPNNISGKNKIDWEQVYQSLDVDVSVKPIEWLKPGESGAQTVLENFLQNKLRTYAEERNDPSNDALSNLSPFLHFGQISAQQVALETKHSDAFFEELVVRKELADNYCLYNSNYDDFSGFPEWAQQTLLEHSSDKREYMYSRSELENAQTHDQAWNAAQIEMITTGKMHGYMRMYWAKKILEWTKHPKEALKIAIYLNDKYELDGRDPNGYVGIAWSIGGVHDRGWTERPIFGKIRYMNFNGLKRKFDIQKYIDKHIS